VSHVAANKCVHVRRFLDRKDVAVMSCHAPSPKIPETWLERTHDSGPVRGAFSKPKVAILWSAMSFIVRCSSMWDAWLQVVFGQQGEYL